MLVIVFMPLCSEIRFNFYSDRHRRDILNLLWFFFQNVYCVHNDNEIEVLIIVYIYMNMQYKTWSAFAYQFCWDGSGIIAITYGQLCCPYWVELLDCQTIQIEVLEALSQLTTVLVNVSLKIDINPFWNINRFSHALFIINLFIYHQLLTIAIKVSIRKA